jgi:fibronectin type 3 domain-containing protein
LAAVNLLTHLTDNSGTGANTSETALTPSNVNVTQFGKLFSSAVDGQVVAQPLYMTGVNITTGANQGIHNVVFVATAHDSLYAFDADNGAKLWQTSFLSATVSGVLDVNPNIATGVTISSVPSGDVNTTDISPEIGVIATPVIDPSTGTIYLTAKTKEIINGNSSVPDYFYQLYAINIQNGHLQTSLGGGVVKIGDTVYSGGNYTNNTSISVAGNGDGSVGGVVKFNTLRQMNRPGLTLYNGRIYIAWASHGDNTPYHGWITGYNASNLQLTGALCLNPNGNDDGIWQSGGKIEIDSSGALYFETGNGLFDSTLNAQGFPVNGDYGDSVVKIVTDSSTPSTPNINGWGFHVADYFAPFNQANLNSQDTDMASSGLAILPDSLGSTAHPHLLLARGKSGVIYLIDRDNMGKFNSTTDHVVQEFSDTGGFWSSPTYAVIGTTAYFYGTPNGGYIQQWSISNGAFSTSVVHSGMGTDTYAFPGATGFISANGTSNGVIWQVEKNTNQLRAYNAATLGAPLYTTAMNAPRDQLGSVIKFSVPIVDNGHVYVGTSNTLVVYGELAAVTQAPAAPTNLATTPLSASQVKLTWTRNSTNEAGFYIERSIDNSTFTQVGLADAGATSFVDSNNLSPSTAYYYRVRAFNSVGNSAYTNVANTTTLLGIAGVWADSDVGTPGATGGASFANNTFTISGSGNDVGGTSDNFHFVYQPLTGDGTIIAHVLTQGSTNALATSGVMIRESLNANSSFSDVVVTPTSGMLFQVRNGTGATAATVASTGGAAPEWVMLVRTGNTLTGYSSVDGISYTKLGATTVSMAQTVFVGLAVTSHADGVLSTTGISNVLVFPPQVYASDLSPTSSTNGSGPIHLDHSQNGNTITLAGTTYTKGLGVRANSDIIYAINGQYSTFVSDIGIDAEVGATGTARFQVFGDGNLLYDTNNYGGNLTGGGTIGHIVVNVAGVNSLDLRVTDGASGGANDHADWAAARFIAGLPAAPSNLSGAVASGSQINLSWTDNSVNENGFQIFREDPNTSTFHAVATVGANVTSYVDAGLQNGQNYSYQIQATNTVGNSGSSNTATISIPTPPAQPTNLHVTQLTTSTIGLAWQIPPTNDDGVKIFRRDTTTSLYSLIATLPANTTSYTDTNLTPGSLHDYDVQTYNIGGFSGPASIELTLLTLPPTGLTAVSGNNHAQLSWTAPNGAMTYNVYRATVSGGEGTTPIATGISATTYQDAAVTSGTTYFYTVTAVDPGGESAQSSESQVAFVIPAATIPAPVPNPTLNSVPSLQIVFNEAVSGFSQSSLSLSLNNGPNLLTSSQTLTTSDNKTFTLNNLSSLTSTAGTYVLKFAAAGSGVVDSVNNFPTNDASTTFVVTHAPPQIAAVYVSSTAWQQSFLNFLAASRLGDAQLGYRIPTGGSQLAALPWTNINVITVQFTEDVTFNTAQSGLALTGSPDLAPAPALSGATFNYTSATKTASWMFSSASALWADKYLLSIPSAAATNVLGANLDGEFTTSSSAFPSGDGTAGGNFNFRFSVLPGDVDQNGVVTGLDGGALRQHFLQFASTPGYNPMFDTYGKGAITGLDYLTVQNTLLTTLPATDPTPPGGGGMQPAAAAAVGSANSAAGSSGTPAATTASAGGTGQTPSQVTTALGRPSSLSTTATTESASGSPLQSLVQLGTLSVDARVASPVVVAPAPQTAGQSHLLDQVFENLTIGKSDASHRFTAILGSVSSLNSLALAPPDRSGVLAARDLLFAEPDIGGLISETKRQF